MQTNKKIIFELNELNFVICEFRAANKKITVCQGHFNVIHPGHLRFLDFAKKQGDILIVIVQGKSKLEKDVRDKFFDIDERAKGVAALELVDKVFIFDELFFEEVIGIIKPNIYVLGEEFANKKGAVRKEISFVESLGGKVIFNSGEIRSSFNEFFDKNFVDIKEERRHLMQNAIAKQGIDIGKLIDICDEFKNKHLLVIGDTIVDQYVSCDALGMSSEAPVLVVRELENKEFIGGAAIVARNAHAMKAKCSFISLVGNDNTGNFVKTELKKENINTKWVIDDARPTTFKIRYMVGAQKILRVSRLKEHHLDKKMEQDVIESLNFLAQGIDGIVVSDFGYGVITPKILEHILFLGKKYKIKLFGDVQSSSQIGNVCKLNGYYCLTPTEKEVRIALNDKYSGLELLGTNLLKKTNSQNILRRIPKEAKH